MGVSWIAMPERRAALDVIEDPRRLRELTPHDLTALAAEIRRALVETVCASGGHLGPNLGVVELTLALHRVFDSPRDRLLFDTGHQAYVHKMVTGRLRRFGTLRQQGGLSGYPSQTESAHDLIENSHASTALSYADGLAKAFALTGESDRAVVAVVGDGALTGGMCWEALNNIGTGGRAVIVVLNDNGRSYAPTVGAAAAHLRRLREETVGSGNLFASLGFSYIGPVDGHQVLAVEQALRRARELRRPVVVHCVTVKGKGYPPAEADEADCLHGVGVVDPATGTPAKTGSTSWTNVFAEEIEAIGADRPDVVCLTASMLRPVGLKRFANRFPERVYDTGIAEQHTVTSAAGLALGGLHPVVAVYATFLNRAFDQVVMDVALHHLPVTFVLDRAGVTGPDGASHHGMWDLSLLSAVPGLRVAAPRDAPRLRQLLREAVAITGGPTVVRFPKASAEGTLPALDRVGQADVLRRDGERCDVLIVSVGPLAADCLAAAALLHERGLAVTVLDPRWPVPVDPTVVALMAEHRLVLTVEDGIRTGGAGTLLARAAADAGVTTPVQVLGLPHGFIPHGNREVLLRQLGFAPDTIAAAVESALAGVGPYQLKPDRAGDSAAASPGSGA